MLKKLLSELNFVDPNLNVLTDLDFKIKSILVFGLIDGQLYQENVILTHSGLDESYFKFQKL